MTLSPFLPFRTFNSPSAFSSLMITSFTNCSLSISSIFSFLFYIFKQLTQRPNLLFTSPSKITYDSLSPPLSICYISTAEHDINLALLSSLHFNASKINGLYKVKVLRLNINSFILDNKWQLPDCFRWLVYK